MATDLSRATFLYRAGQEQNFPIPDRPEVRVGFGRSNDVSIPFEGVSRNHAKLSFDGKAYWIEDAGSANGTFLNGRRVSKKQRIEHLDIVSLGRKTDLIFTRKQVKVARTTRRGICSAWLEILDGPDAGTRREIPRGSITMGRSRNNNVVADSHLVSKIHARLERTGVQLILVDLHSSNGTFADGEKLDSKILKDGDEFNLGGARTYRVSIEEGDMETRDVPLSLSADAKVGPPLPTDWKTRIEWSPEEQAAIDGALGRASPSVQASKPAPGSPQKTVLARVPPPGASLQAAQRGPSLAQSSDRAAAGPAMPLSPKGVTPPPAPKQAPAAPPSSPRPKAAPPRAPAVPPLPAPSRPAEPAPGPHVFLEGETRTFALAVGTHEVGRVLATSIHVEGPQISRRHAVIRVTETEAIVEDLGSSNGTFVNNQRIGTPRKLVPGDLVAFGDVRFRVRFASGPGARRKEDGEK